LLTASERAWPKEGKAKTETATKLAIMDFLKYFDMESHISKSNDKFQCTWI